MPWKKIKGLDLYYEIHGMGFPLVLIRGLGSNADHWYDQIPAFSPYFSVVIFDNRGLGRSSKPEGPISILQMAEDTIGLLDELKIPKAHVLGISMGGMIAQEMALHFPTRIAGLILGCTHCGGIKAIRPAEEILRLFYKYLNANSPAFDLDILKCFFADQTIRHSPQVFQRYQQVSSKFPPSKDILFEQVRAVMNHDTWERLPSIQNPTLILSGAEDVLVPPENSQILAERIPQAKLKIIEGGGHQFLIEKPAAFNKEVLDFLLTI